MKGKSVLKTLYLLVLFFVVSLMTPSDVYAASINCNYSDSDNKITISINKSSMTANVKFTKLTSAGKTAYERVPTLRNWSSLSKNITNKSLDGEKMCPNYVFVVRCNGNTQTGNQDVFEAYGYYKKSTADSGYSSKKRCVNGNNFIKEKTSVLKKSGTADYNVESAQDGQYNNSQASVSEEAKKEEEEISNKKLADINMVGDENATTCVEVLGESVVEFLQMLFNYVKVLGPILVIILSSIDFTKTVMTGDEQSMKKAQNNLFIRLLCAVGIFLLPTIVTIIINLITGSGIDSTLCGIK